jgi:hypothetical protein
VKPLGILAVAGIAIPGGVKKIPDSFFKRKPADGRSRPDLLYGKSTLIIQKQFEQKSRQAMSNNPRAAIDLVHDAIAAGSFGQIQWEDRADQRARNNSDLRGLTPEGIRRLLHDFVLGVGRLDERREARPHWLEANADRPAYCRDWWYRAVVPVPGLFPNGLFVEVRLFDDDAQDPWVEIVNAHPQV